MTIANEIAERCASEWGEELRYHADRAAFAKRAITEALELAATRVANLRQSGTTGRYQGSWNHAVAHAEERIREMMRDAP